MLSPPLLIPLSHLLAIVVEEEEELLEVYFKAIGVFAI
jgi:hypothetical protein